MFDTDYCGQVEWVQVEAGGRTWEVLRPSDPDGLLSEPAVLSLNQKHDYMPYWAYLWPGAFLLGEAIARRSWPRDTWSLELGCGLGLAGLVALGCGLRVQFTDHDRAPLRFVEQSVTRNAFSADRMKFGVLDWTAPTAEQFPIILGADLLYEARLVPLVANVIDCMLTPDGIALLAGPARAPTEMLPQCLAQHGLRAQTLPLTARNEQGQRIHGCVHEVMRAD